MHNYKEFVSQHHDWILLYIILNCFTIKVPVIICREYSVTSNPSLLQKLEKSQNRQTMYKVESYLLSDLLDSGIRKNLVAATI
jgi:hypothetical protein